jgi:hypothetical protein
MLSVQSSVPSFLKDRAAAQEILRFHALTFQRMINRSPCRHVLRATHFNFAVQIDVNQEQAGCCRMEPVFMSKILTAHISLLYYARKLERMKVTLSLTSF